jgi:hypothetical protein
MRKSDLAKAGDKIKYQVHLTVSEGYNHQKGILYDGYIIRHSINSITEVEFIGDDGTLVRDTMYYNSFNSGESSFELLISDEEFEKRKAEWLADAIKEAEQVFSERIEFLKSITFD